MADKVGDEFDGYITGVSAFGLYIELVEHFVEGMVHVSTMADDYYRFVERAHMLRGEKNGRVYRLGDRVSVQVIRVDTRTAANRSGADRDSRSGPRAGGTDTRATARRTRRQDNSAAAAGRAEASESAGAGARRANRPTRRRAIDGASGRSEEREVPAA